MSGWQPIETAPKDGTSVMVFGPRHKNDSPTGEHYIEICKHYLGRWTIVWMDGCAEPTHWMPLPEPPQ